MGGEFMLTMTHGSRGISFERYTDRARRVIVLAEAGAKEMRHAQIGTGHLLLGLVTEGGGVASQALAALGITEAAVMDAVVASEIEVPGSVASRPLPFAADARKVLELALREALQLGNNYIGTEHLLLGLVREASGAEDARPLTRLGVRPANIRNKVLELLAGYAERGEPRVEESRPVTLDDVMAAVRAVDARVTALAAHLGLADDTERTA